jgi:membrane associated rhomboid family serine protease
MEFDRKEVRASKCKKQLLTCSTFICIIQIALLIAMIQDDGYAPTSENPMYGPSGYTLVRYGAKDAALIKYKNEWWRLITPIFLHAGIIHLLSNVAIQVRVGGYLELVYGSPIWLFIYFSSGIYGNMLSCIFLPDSVGIGSSGAVLGMLTSWIVWILFRWKKTPPEHKGHRNCQLLVVTAAVAMTLAFSFTDYGKFYDLSLCVIILLMNVDILFPQLNISFIFIIS